MAFVKLDCGMLDSTIWLDRDARLLFITALLMAEPFELREPAAQIAVDSLEETGFVVPPGWYGFIQAAGPGIVRRADMDQERGMAALHRLGSPEPGSRTTVFEGRRLIRVDGGFIALNFIKYREKDATTADRSRRWRERKKQNASTVATRRDDTEQRVIRHQAEAEAEAEAENTNTPIADGSANEGSQEAPKGGVSKAPRPRDPLFDALAEADGSNPQQLTRSAARAIGVALAEIRRVCPDLTPGEIMRRMGHYRLLMPNVRPTATGLAKHWARCDTEPESIEQKGFGFAR